MNLRWYDRILVALSGLVLIALGVCVILAAGNVIQLPEAIAFDTWLGTGWQWMPLIFLAGILIIVWGMWLFIRPFRRKGDARGKYYLLKGEDDGDVKISINAIDHLVHKCVSAYTQIVSTKVKITGKEDAMVITLHMTVKTDVRIPNLVDEVRADIIRSLEHSAGVTVSSVQIYVDATKDDKDGEMKYIEAKSKEPEPVFTEKMEEPVFYTPSAPVVQAAPEPPVMPKEPTIAELKKEIDLGPDEPMPVTLSDGAFPFPEEEAGVPLEIYTPDIPLENDENQKGAGTDAG